MWEWRDPQSVLVKRSEEKGPLGKFVVARNVVLIYSFKKRIAKFSIYNLHVIPTLKESFNFIS
jgi:hypothetical protein